LRLAALALEGKNFGLARPRKARLRHVAMKRLLFLITALISLVSCRAAEPASVPEIVKQGFDIYLKAGPKAGVDAWLKGSPLQNDKSAISAVVGGLTNVEVAYGKFIGWETIKVVLLSESTRRVYVVAKYERGPLFCSFDCYKSTDWIIPTFNVHTKANEILPSFLLSGQ
jgi:hypothetical protein